MDAQLLDERFWRNVCKSDVDSCWEWTAALRAGYGCIKVSGKLESCHRLAFVLTYGPVPDGMIVGHKCDNRKCCNPAHLEAITYRQNAIDKFARQRQVNAKGSANYGAKLTELQVVEARRMNKQLGYGYKKIARLMGVQSVFALREAISGKTWKHI